MGSSGSQRLKELIRRRTRIKALKSILRMCLTMKQPGISDSPFCGFPYREYAQASPSYVRGMREELDQLSSMGPDQLGKPQTRQKMWYYIRHTSPGRIRQTSTRVPARLTSTLKQEVQAKLEREMMQPSHSEWCSPVVLVGKKGRRTPLLCGLFTACNVIADFLSRQHTDAHSYGTHGDRRDSNTLPPYTDL